MSLAAGLTTAVCEGIISRVLADMSICRNRTVIPLLCPGGVTRHSPFAIRNSPYPEKFWPVFDPSHRVSCRCLRARRDPDFCWKRKRP
jgi:hypothetical protein